MVLFVEFCDWAIKKSLDIDDDDNDDNSDLNLEQLQSSKSRDVALKNWQKLGLRI